MFPFRRVSHSGNHPHYNRPHQSRKPFKMTRVKAGLLGLAASAGLIAPSVVQANNAGDIFERANEVITAGNAVDETLNNNPKAYAELLDSGIRDLDITFDNNETVEDVLQQLSYDDKSFIAVDLYLNHVSNTIFADDPDLASAFNTAVNRGLLNNADARYQFVQELDNVSSFAETEVFLKNVLNTSIVNNLEGSPDDQTVTLQRMQQGFNTFFNDTNNHVDSVTNTFYTGTIGIFGFMASLFALTGGKTITLGNKRHESDDKKNEIHFEDPPKR